MSYQNKKNGFSPIVIILLAAIGIGIIAGTSRYLKNKGLQDEEGRQVSQGLEEASNNPQQRGNIQFMGAQSAGSLDDLVTGEEIMVTGVENSDKSIAAEAIFVGLLEQNLEENQNFSPGDMMAMVSPSEGIRPSLPEGINEEDFGSLSPEARRQQMQELRGNGVLFNRQADDNFTRIRGEIIGKDESTITIKLIDGGSRLVFYSDNTQIVKIVGGKGDI